MRLAHHDQALAWFTGEHRVLLAVVDRTADYESARTWQLALTITEFLDRRGHWHDWANVQRAGLEAARRQPDRPGQARSHRSLGRATCGSAAWNLPTNTSGRLSTSSTISAT